MPSLPSLRLLIALAALPPCFGAGQPAAEPAEAENAIKAAWGNAALGLFNQANIEFAQLPGNEARLGEAVTLLLKQPKTDGNLNRAAAMLEQLVNDDPESSLAITARYYLGRIEQTHRSSGNPEAARAIFRNLVTGHAGHPYADLAAVKLALIELYSQQSDTDRRARFDEFVALAPALKTPSARRDLSLLLADVAQRFGYEPSLTLDLLLAADEVGIARRVEQGNIWIRIGQLAQDTGRADVARAYYNRYLSTFIRDNRRRMVSERLAALPSPESPKDSK